MHKIIRFRKVGEIFKKNIFLLYEIGHSSTSKIGMIDYLTLGSSVPGGPIGGQTNVQLRNEHLSYIVTW